ncbi:hypothetical protein [Tychonema sp. BBK16]
MFFHQIDGNCLYIYRNQCWVVEARYKVWAIASLEETQRSLEA